LLTATPESRKAGWRSGVPQTLMMLEELRETQRVGALIHSHDTGRRARPYGASHQRPVEVAVHPGRPPDHRPVDHLGLIYICFYIISIINFIYCNNLIYLLY